ncbi:putative ATP-dependent RNA helicase DDX28 [Holothuria leucospilota]|uniref:RNA helicase n=1 Tax=Holothuria leucospilota TaxID=206669 RepID=A0A9Q1B9L5_HOLLE|nr:putative ATP-dependent RNA helicase DDX28 [Holothuria leucospilota]
MHSLAVSQGMIPSSHCKCWLVFSRCIRMSAQTGIGATIDVPVIKVPKRLEKRVEEIRRMKESEGEFQWQGRVFNARPGKELISAKRKEFNYYQNQLFRTSVPQKLASHGWKHRKSRGDFFTLLAYRGNPSVQDGEIRGQSQLSFDDYGIDRRLLTRLEDMDIRKPTIIQDLAIPVLMKGKNALFAAETGSGKTLAYLLPLLNSLLKLRDVCQNEDVGRPWSLILVPAQELAHQVHSVVTNLSRDHGIVCELLDGAGSLKLCKSTLEKPIDVLVATSGRLNMSLKHRLFSLQSIRHTVIDEADTLLDDSFKSSTVHILKKMEINQKPASPLSGSFGSQLIMAGATMPKQATLALGEVLSENSLTVLSTPHLHRIQPHINQKFLRLHTTDKAVTLLKILSQDARKNTSVMIFCNEASTCNWVAYLLEENGFSCLRLNGAMKIQERRGVMEAYQSGSSNILVSTDIASRGIDTSRVEHIINFDFPNHMSDYIHRVGRVGRVSSRKGGRVTSFVVHKWDVDLVHKIETAVRTRESLPRVDANIKRKHILRNTEIPFNQIMFE